MVKTMEEYYKNLSEAELEFKRHDAYTSLQASFGRNNKVWERIEELMALEHEAGRRVNPNE